MWAASTAASSLCSTPGRGVPVTQYVAMKPAPLASKLDQDLEKLEGVDMESMDNEDNQEFSISAEDVDGMDLDLDGDVYGAGIFSIVCDTTEIISHNDVDQLAFCTNWSRLSFTVLSLCINYVIQFALLYCAWVYLVTPAVRNIQLIYGKFHAEVFENDGAFNRTKWATWLDDDRHALCNLPFTNGYPAVFIILSLWWMTILFEFRKTYKLLRNIIMVRPTRNLDHQLKHDDDGRARRILALVKPIRWALYVTICGGKLLISVQLAITGTVWLCASADYSELLLNSVALEFIILVDETIFNAMFPEVMKDNLRKAKLFICMDTSIAPERRRLTRELREGLAYYLFIVLFVWFYLGAGQDLPLIGVLPGYMNDASCPEYWRKMSMPVCGWEKRGNCFPFGQQGMVTCTQLPDGRLDCPHGAIVNASGFYTHG